MKKLCQALSLMIFHSVVSFCCLCFVGFFAFGLIGEKRFRNAMHNFEDIPSTADPVEVIDGFQTVLDYTYSSYFLPGQGRRLRNDVIMKFADYLLFAGRDDSRAQKIFLKAFLLQPEDSPYRAPLLSILGRGGDLTPGEIDLLLVILKAEEFCDDVIVSHLASLFLRKRLFTRKTEPVFLSALENGSEDSEEIVGLFSLNSWKRTGSMCSRCAFTSGRCRGRFLEYHVLVNWSPGFIAKLT